MDQDVHRPDHRRDLRGVHQAGEREVVGQSRRGDRPLVFITEDSVADQQELHMRVGCDDAAGGGDQVVVTFEVEQPSDLSDDDVVVDKAESPTDGVAVFVRVQERFDVHAAGDRRELLSRGHSRGDQLVGHRVGDADHPVATPGGPTFTPSKELAGDRRLVIVERCAVDGVNHRRHAERPRRGAAEQSAFGTVRVNDVWRERS